jgi:hypothetical protein
MWWMITYFMFSKHKLNNNPHTVVLWVVTPCSLVYGYLTLLCKLNPTPIPTGTARLYPLHITIAPTALPYKLSLHRPHHQHLYIYDKPSLSMQLRLLDCLTLKMKPLHSFKMLGTTLIMTWYHFPKILHLQITFQNLFCSQHWMKDKVKKPIKTTCNITLEPSHF